MELPAETVRELKAGDIVGECPLCRRILLVGYDPETDVTGADAAEPGEAEAADVE
jgi:hypothetical protein